MRSSRKIVGLVLIVALAFGTGLFTAADSLAQAGRGYRQVNLVSDVAGVARSVDAFLVNPWGIVVHNGVVWVADNGAGISTAYLPNGKILPYEIYTPGPKYHGTANPTGMVFNPTNDFWINHINSTSPAHLLYATEQGTVEGWNFYINDSRAVIPIDNSSLDAVYKGIALGQVAGANFLYVTNFHSGYVEMYNGFFNRVKAFTDPNIPAGYAPFGIRNIGDRLFVTYAKQDAAGQDDIPGRGNGFVDIFDLAGTTVTRLITQGTLNSPWGLALAPADFGEASNLLLVGNFGNGYIDTFDPQTGAFMGRLRDRSGNLIQIDGLWGLEFGEAITQPGGTAHPVLYFTAGPNQETEGLLGYLTK
jgi:uncharacterized protein (TIGR03118 family)